jgi:hypothetical protein
VERQSVEGAELEGVVTLNALTHVPGEKSEGPNLFLHDPQIPKFARVRQIELTM